MKKLGIALIIILLYSSTAMAKIFIDGGVGLVDAGDAESQTGFNWGLGFDLQNNVNFVYKASSTTLVEEDTISGMIYETEYEHFMQHGGVEYIVHFTDFHVHWNSFAGVGWASTRVKEKESGIEVEDSGMSMLFSTGVTFDATQKISPFANIGYHYSYYVGDFKDESIQGLTFHFGIRFTVWGNARDINSEY